MEKEERVERPDGDELPQQSEIRNASTHWFGWAVLY
jgi:hypothetical protein